MAVINLKAMKVDDVSMRIIGTTPLVQHKWIEKMRKQIRDKKMGKKVTNREKCDPQQEFIGATYVGKETGKYGVPCDAIKQCLVNAAHKDIGIEKTLVRKSIFIKSQDRDLIEPRDLVLFDQTDDPIMREDIVRVGAGSADLRYRPEFQNWSIIFTAQLNTDDIPLDSLINLVNRAGFGVGLQEMRPEKGGDFGRFTVDTSYVQVLEHELEGVA